MRQERHTLASLRAPRGHRTTCLRSIDTARRFFGCALTTIVAAGCTNTRLEFPEQEVAQPEVDDQLEINGQFCASPAADIAYPVKVMFIVDGSGSQQFSDQNRQRVVAVEEAINALIGAPNIYFKVIVFNAAVTATPGTASNQPVFTNDLNRLMPALANLAESDTLTDYQGALATAYSELLRDMQTVSADSQRGSAELGRTKYVLIFISDGFPDPQCQAGLGNDLDPNWPDGINHLCEDQDYLNCVMQVTDPVLGPTECTNGVCVFNGTSCYEVENAATLFGGLATTELVAGADYNQPYQLLQKVDDIMELANRFDVGEIRLHAGLVLDPLADPAVIAIFGDPTQAIPLMEEMAKSGEGTYMEFYGGDQIDFLSINYESIKQPRVVRGFFADNRSALVRTNGLEADSDNDGLTDNEEIQIGTLPRRADTDGDGYGDALEWRRRGWGFDPTNPCLPPIVDVPGADPTAACDPASPMSCNFEYGVDPVTGAVGRAYVDSDRDGLHDCEERQLGTGASTADTDHDGMIDRMEVLLGLDPLRWDAERDDDQDSIANVQEIEWHLNPLVAQNDTAARDRYRYDRPEISASIDGRPCYNFSVKHIRLMPTSANEDHGPEIGVNEVRLFILENMADDLAGEPLVRTACVRARYVPPGLKVPASGVLTLTEDNFGYLPSNDPIFNDPQAAARLFEPTVDCVVAE